jgi:pyrroline-5-carboxylate reductase
MQSYVTDAGFSDSQAQQMTSQVLRDTAALIEGSGKEFSVICHEMRAPGGTTEHRINCFKQYRLRDIIRRTF